MDEEKKLLQPTLRALMPNYSAAFGCKLSFEYHLREIHNSDGGNDSVFLLLRECEKTN